MEALVAIVRALWLMLPMLAPNSAAVLLGGGTPIDFGRKMKDGTRVLGDGKTWRGLFGGTIVGIALGLILGIIATCVFDAPDWAYGGFYATLLTLFCLSFGSMLGDLVGSFIKRRMKKDRGANVPGLDQYNFFISALVFILIFRFTWFKDNFLTGVNLVGFVALIIIIPLLHRGVNIIGYKMGKKNVPW
jgi:CDP-2,3-bis-(O-geranylgeranyl)-sn-glycerol synthase